ncbi:Toxin HigB-1 [compost metagenome]
MTAPIQFAYSRLVNWVILQECTNALSFNQLEMCKVLPYTLTPMIRSFRHKGLRTLYQRGEVSGMRADHIARLRRLLAALDVAQTPSSMDRPGNRLHMLRGNLEGFWAVSVSGNWRLIFRFVGTDVELVDYLDYH